FFFSSRRRHTRFSRDWSSDVCSSDLAPDPGFQLLAGDNGRRGFHQRLEDLERGRIELDQLAAAADLEGVEVVFEVGDLQHAGLRSEERRVGKEGRVGWEGGR